MAAKGLISQQQLLNNSIQQHPPPIIKPSNQIANGNAEHKSKPNGKVAHQTSSTNSTQLIYTQSNDSANQSKRNTLTSDGRSAEDECNQSDGYSPTIRSEPDAQTSFNKSLVESKSSSGNSSGSSPPPQAPNSVVVEMYENLAAELKAKLGNPETGPILLPPRDYDTVCRSQGRLIELDQRACTNKLVVGVGKLKKIEQATPLKKSDNLVLDTNVKEIKVPKDDKMDSKDRKDEAVKSVPVNSKVKEESANKKKHDEQSDKPVAKVNKTDNRNRDEFNKQVERLNHQQIREQQKQYEQKLKNLQRKQELYEQQQLLIEQQKQVRRELSQQHKPSKFVEEQLSKPNGKISNRPTTTGKSNSKEQQIKAKSLSDEPTKSTPPPNSVETSAVIHTGGIKQIGSNLANKIKQSLIGSNREKLEPQLICHKTIHDSLQSLNKLTKTELSKSNDKFINKNFKQIDKLMKSTNERLMKNRSSSSTTKSNTMNTSMSNSSSNMSRDLNEKLNTMNSRSSKSISSGIGSANLNKSNTNNYDDQPYLSTDEELDDEMLIHDLSECVDEYMPDYAYNQYLNDAVDQDDEIIDDLDEEVSDRVIRRMAIKEKLLLLEKSNQQKGKEGKKTKTEFGSTGERVQTSSEEDDGTNSICYDENLMPKINTAKRMKKPTNKATRSDQKTVDNVKNAKNISNSKTNSSATTGKTDQQPAKLSANIQPSINHPVKRSETYYEMNSGQKKMFHNNFYFPRTNKSPLNSLDSSILQHPPKLFYFPNPDFTAAAKQQQLLNSSQAAKQPQLMKYHLGQQAVKQCDLRRQKSTPNVNGKMNYHPMLINGRPLNAGSVEKLLSGDLKPNLDKYAPPTNLVHQRTRPISMVNMMQPDMFRIAHHPPLEQNGMFKRVPIFY